MTQRQDPVSTLLDEARQCELESQTRVLELNFREAADLQVVASLLRNIAKDYSKKTGQPLCA
ncbi:hypothetical protein [Acetobacter cerevisiae]|nr:hypothetical protein [Acetobacter cerevisiae]